MAITNGYCTLAELQTRLGIDHQNQTQNLEYSVETASREIDSYCNRHFYTDTAATRYIPHSYDGLVLDIPDLIHGAITSVAVSTGDNNTYDQTWTENTHFVAFPYAGEISDGVQHPVTELHAITRVWPTLGKWPRRVKIVGNFGWGAVPTPVRQAAMELAAYRYKTRESPLGVAGFGDFGLVRNMELRSIGHMLMPYKKQLVFV